MANTYTLSMTSINLDSVAIAVGNRTGDPLIANDIKIRRYNAGVYEDYTDFTLAADPAPTATTATIIPNTIFTQTDILLIQISDAGGKSDRILLDFAEDYTGHDAVYNFEIPAEAGNYKLQLDKVNEEDFSAVESNEITVGNAPTTDYSSITIPKDYLVKYIGDIINLTVTLNNATGDAVVGNYEVLIVAALQ